MARSASRSRGFVVSQTTVLKKLRISQAPELGVAVTIGIEGASAGSTLSVTSGALPVGMVLNSAARTITGTPTVAGTSAFTITETLVGPTNSPKATALSIEVVAGSVPYRLEPTEKLIVTPSNGATIRVTSADGVVNKAITAPTTFGPYMVGQTLTVAGAATATKTDLASGASAATFDRWSADVGLAPKKQILLGASAGQNSGWLPISPNPERLFYQLDSGTASTQFSIDISADGETSLGQAFTSLGAASASGEFTPPLMFSNPRARFYRFNVISGGPLSVYRNA